MTAMAISRLVSRIGGFVMDESRAKTRPGRAVAAPWPRSTLQRRSAPLLPPPTATAACLSAVLHACRDDYTAHRASSIIFSPRRARQDRASPKRGESAPARQSRIMQKCSRGRKGLTSLSSVSLFSPYPSGGRNVEQGHGALCFPLCPIHSTAHFSSNSARHKSAVECSRWRDDCKT